MFTDKNNCPWTGRRFDGQKKLSVDNGCPQNQRPLSTDNADVYVVRKSYKTQTC
jgi:hypothetical protein